MIQFMNNIKNLVSEELSYVDAKINTLIINKNLDTKLHDFLNASDKRIRSLVLFLYLKSQNYVITKEVLDVAFAGEIVHNASLLQDDIIDESDKRRGLQTFSKEFSPKISLLVGDNLLTEAVSILLKMNNAEILQVFLNSIKMMSSAEITQFFNRGTIPSEEVYINICRGKTASLFEAMFHASAILLKKPEKKFVEFAKLFGIIFQINNDLSPNSEQNDIDNKIYTAKKVLGIEKTKILTHNYLEELRYSIRTISPNKYQEGLEELLNYYEL